MDLLYCVVHVISSSGSSSVGQPSSESIQEEEEGRQEGKESEGGGSRGQQLVGEGETLRSKSPESVFSDRTVSLSISQRQQSPRTRVPRGRRDLREELPNRSNSVGSGDLQLLNGTGHLSPHVAHRRQASLGVLNPSSNSPHHKHQRQLSLSTSGHTSKSTSAYSTLSERSTASLQLEGQETESICSNRSRISLLPSSRVEQSRVDAKSVVEKLFQTHDLLRTDEEEGSGGLKIYVDKNRGTVTVAGPDLDR